MIGLSVSQSLLRPRQSSVALAAVGEHGGTGGPHFDFAHSHEHYTRGQQQQHRLMSMAATGVGGGRRGVQRISIRRASECPFETLTLDAGRLSALAAERRRSSSARSGSLASSASAMRSRVNTSVSAPDAQFQQHLPPLQQPIQVDETTPLAPHVAGSSGEPHVQVTVRRKEPRYHHHPSSPHEQQRKESASELKLRLRALSQASACEAIPEEPSDANADTYGSRLVSNASGAAAASASATAPSHAQAPELEGSHALSPSHVNMSSSGEHAQSPDRSRASSYSHERALLATLTRGASTQALSVNGEQDLVLDEQEFEVVDVQMAAAGDFTHAPPGNEFLRALIWGFVVAVLLVVSGKLLEIVEGAHEASSAALIASARNALEYSLERSLDALIHNCTNTSRNGSGDSGSGGGGGGGDCRHAGALHSSVSQLIDELRSALEQQIVQKYATDPRQTKWTFANAVFLQWTAITTIGSIGTVLSFVE